MTVIRFSRRGTKKRPVFHLVVQNKTSPRDGKFIEHLGNFLPRAKENSFTVKKDRLQYWLGVGAQPSNSVTSHLRSVFAEFRAPNTASTHASSATPYETHTVAKVAEPNLKPAAQRKTSPKKGD